MAKSAKPTQAKRKSTAAPRKRSGRRVRTRPDFQNYHAAVKYLLEHTDVERVRASRVNPDVFTLDRMVAILKALDNPHQDLRTAHIAGTNGKGSAVAMLDACLRECGCTVGTYTSPHLTDLRERIQINDTHIPHPAFTALLSEVARAADTLPKKLGSPTFFELLTAVAFLRFAEQAVDIALIEVGLGGRLDSTNVITPDVTAITGIALDHTHFLGQSIAEIAAEKGGIFKPGIPALTIPQEPEVVAALREVASSAEAPFEVLGDEIEFSYRFEASPQLGPHTRVGLSSPRCTFEHVPVPLMGEHQALNCGLVLAMLDKLTARGFDLPEPQVIEGLAKTTVPGRMEMVWRDPRILLDGAHNPAAVSALIKSIGAHIPYDSMVMIFGCAADKDVDEMLRRVALGADKVIFTRAKGNPRAMDPLELSKQFAHLSGKMSQVADNLDEALSIAARAAGRDDLVAVTGSFYLVGEAKKLLTLRAEKAGMPELVQQA